MPKTSAKSHHHGKIPAGEEGKKLVKKQEIGRESRKNIGNSTFLAQYKSTVGPTYCFFGRTTILLHSLLIAMFNAVNLSKSLLKCCILFKDSD